MKPQKDIYHIEHYYKRAREKLLKSDISGRNKELILKFDEMCSLEKLGLFRKVKLMCSLVILARDYLKEDFDKATRDDLKQVVLKIDGRDDLSEWTKHGYKAMLRKFYRWLTFGDSYRERIEQPEIINWLKVGMSEKDKPRVKASDILTEKEIEKLIEVAEHPRDRAFISILYELGARIGEIGALRIKDISRDKYSFVVDLSGKTGHRTPRIVVSDSYLNVWLNMHPFRSNANAPLWILLGERNKNKRMDYVALRALVLRLKEKAKISKRVYPHLFRHTRVTHLLINKQINESQAKVYFGWVPSSTMLSEYSHLVSQDVNNVMLEMHGIKISGGAEQRPKIKQCPRCRDINPSGHLFCRKCSSALDVKTALELDDKRSGFDDIVVSLTEDENVQEALLKAMMKKGLGKKLMKLWNK